MQRTTILDLKKYFVTAVVTAGLALPVQTLAQGGSNTETPTNPYSYPDDSIVQLSGTVESVESDSFVLSFAAHKGTARITVEMDDADRDSETYALDSGDKVSVTGIIDDDIFERRTIEASSVYVEKLNTNFFASGVDEENSSFLFPVTMNVTPPVVWLQGKVAEVSEDSFTLDTGTNDLSVDVQQLANNPLDDEGYQKIETGDIVNITGNLEDGAADSHVVVADSIIEIHQGRTVNAL